jgi:hypothetical protein
MKVICLAGWRHAGLSPAGVQRLLEVLEVALSPGAARAVDCLGCFDQFWELFSSAGEELQIEKTLFLDRLEGMFDNIDVEVGRVLISNLVKEALLGEEGLLLLYNLDLSYFFTQEKVKELLPDAKLVQILLPEEKLMEDYLKQYPNAKEEDARREVHKKWEALAKYRDITSLQFHMTGEEEIPLLAADVIKLFYQNKQLLS